MYSNFNILQATQNQLQEVTKMKLVNALIYICKFFLIMSIEQ